MSVQIVGEFINEEVRKANEDARKAQEQAREVKKRQLLAEKRNCKNCNAVLERGDMELHYIECILNPIPVNDSVNPIPVNNSVNPIPVNDSVNPIPVNVSVNPIPVENSNPTADTSNTVKCDFCEERFLDIASAENHGKEVHKDMFITDDIEDDDNDVNVVQETIGTSPESRKVNPTPSDEPAVKIIDIHSILGKAQDTSKQDANINPKSLIEPFNKIAKSRESLI